MGVNESTEAVTWLGTNLSFWLITAMVLVSAFFAALSRNVVRAAYSLFFTLLGMAGYYVLLGSGFLAITQVIIYVGGILVLLMFGVLLTNRPLTGIQENHTRRMMISSLLGLLLLFFVIGRIIWFTEWPAAQVVTSPQVSVRALGAMLLDDYLLALELSGVSLLLCLIGAAYLVRRQEH